MSGGVGSISSPTGGRPGTGNSYSKRKRNGAEFESSPGSGGEGEEDEGDKRSRQPGVKRACNECRQQKVSHGRRTKHDANRRRGCDNDIVIHEADCILNSCAAMSFKTLFKAARGAID